MILKSSIRNIPYGFVTCSIISSLLLYSTVGRAQEAPLPTPQPPVATDAQQPSQTLTAPAVTKPDITSTKFDDWYYRCVDAKAADGKTVASCEVAQIAQVKQNGQDVNVLTLAIAKTTPAAATKSKEARSELLLTVLVPLNVFLPSGFSITAPDKPVVQIAYRNCNQAGCWAQQKLDAKMLAALQKNSEAAGSLRLMNGQNINIKFSLKGLSAALTELQKPASK